MFLPSPLPNRWRRAGQQGRTEMHCCNAFRCLVFASLETEVTGQLRIKLESPEPPGPFRSHLTHEKAAIRVISKK